MERALASATQVLLGRTATSVAVLQLLMNPAQVTENATTTLLLALVMLVLVGSTVMRKRALQTELACHVQAMENAKKVFAFVLIVGLPLIALHQLALICAQAMANVMPQRLANVSLDGKGKIALYVNALEAALAMENAIPMLVVSLVSV